MQSTFIKISNKNYIQIYLTREEFEKAETKEFIQKFIKQKYKISIFLAGENNYTETLKKIIDKQVESDKKEEK